MSFSIVGSFTSSKWEHGDKPEDYNEKHKNVVTSNGMVDVFFISVHPSNCMYFNTDDFVLF